MIGTCEIRDEQCFIFLDTMTSNLEFELLFLSDFLCELQPLGEKVVISNIVVI